MQRNTEESERIHDAENRWIQAAISRTCFTEIKLSMAKSHAQEYGNLGIGVIREFVIERYGNPVFYVTNGDHSNIVTCAIKIRDFLDKTDQNILGEFRTLLSYFKKMGEQNSNDLLYYDELEWRITHLNRLEQEGLITVQDRSEHIYRIKLQSEDVRVLVFPDKRTKDMALENKDVVGLMGKPICVTMDDCENF